VDAGCLYVCVHRAAIHEHDGGPAQRLDAHRELGEPLSAVSSPVPISRAIATPIAIEPFGTSLPVVTMK
jgi:hypothetical protein